MENNNITAASVTKEMIESWKKKFGEGEVFVYRVEDENGDEKVAYLRKPSRKTVSYSSAVQNNPIKSNEVLLNGCWLAGDEEIKTDDRLFYGVSRKLGELIEAKTGELEKL